MMARKKRKVSVGRAILVGTIVVNGPVLALIASPLLLTKRVPNGPWALVLVLGAIALAWLWWSLSVPLWRVWAYSRVRNIALLRAKAVEAGLTWKDGHIFARTEIKSKRIREIEMAHEAQLKADENGQSPEAAPERTREG
jgi:hypothetical protein